MAILAILVAGVAPNLIDSRDSSIESQALTDATTVRAAANDFFSGINASEVRTPHTITTSSGVGGAVAIDQEQIVSSRWPEMYVT